jgi:CBS domain-containing protein
MEPQGVVPATAKMEKAMAEMEEHDVSSIVLVKDERPVGIITVKDIISDYSSDRSRKVRDV